MKANLQLVLCFFVLLATIIPVISSEPPGQDDFLCKQSQAYSVTRMPSLLCTASGSEDSIIVVTRVIASFTKEAFKDISAECNGLPTCPMTGYINKIVPDHLDNPGEFLEVHYKCLTAKIFTPSKSIKSKSNPASAKVLRLSPGHEDNWYMRATTPALQISMVNCVTDDNGPCLLKDFVNVTSSMTDVDFDDRGFGCLSINTSGLVLNMSATYQKVESPNAIPLLIYFKGVNNCSEEVITNTTNETLVCTFGETSQSGQTDTDENVDRNVTVEIEETVTSVIVDTKNDTRRGTALTEQNAINQDKGRDISDDDKTNAQKDVQDEVIIVIVAVLAVVIILVCVAVLVAKVVRKRRKRERPLLVKSQKGDEESPEGHQNEVDGTAFLDDVTTGSRFGHTYVAAPDKNLLETSLTDAIDLDGSIKSDSSRPTSIHKTNEETNLRVAFERQLSPVSYESAFEGTLDDVVLELARKSQDSDSESLSSNVTQTTDGRDLGDGEDNQVVEAIQEINGSKNEEEAHVGTPDLSQKTEADDGANSKPNDIPERSQGETQPPSGGDETIVAEKSEQEELDEAESFPAHGEIPVVKITQAPDRNGNEMTGKLTLPPQRENTPDPPDNEVCKGDDSEPDYDEFAGWPDEDAPRSPRNVNLREHSDDVPAPPDEESGPTSFVMVENDIH